jgi:hypothetical protein
MTTFSLPQNQHSIFYSLILVSTLASRHRSSVHAMSTDKVIDNRQQHNTRKQHDRKVHLRNTRQHEWSLSVGTGSYYLPLVQ